MGVCGCVGLGIWYSHGSDSVGGKIKMLPVQFESNVEGCYDVVSADSLETSTMRSVMK